ncbi:uncharacterized protein LOC135957498 [Calliphora vicina]|uniref:uncharacterized protein LOC135957498 n=1 Tax=Calliphora vicina TaxID=7373 RepID=UPI00325AB0E6
MWKLVEISQQTNFIYCNFNDNTQEVTFILYDLKETWSQRLSLTDVKQKVKLLNKRFDFSEDNIKEAFTSDAPQSAAIEEQAHTSAINVDTCILKLKYRVKNCPFNYEWTLKRQTVIEFQKTFVQPLLMALLGCHQQVEILTENLRKKDIELQQYRIEKGLLNRKTLATKPFDLDDFNKKYEDCNTIAINFTELAKYVKETASNQVPDILNKPANVNKIENDIKPQENLNDVQITNTKLSPRQRKRKVNEQKLQLLEKHLKVRRQGLEYESSQSQALSSGDSQTIEEKEETHTKQPQKRSTREAATESKIDNKSPTRKSARCTPTKQKKYYMSSDDSESDNHLKTIKETKPTRDLVNLTKDVSTNSSKEHNTKNPDNNSKETTRKCVKSVNLAYNCQTKSPEKSSQSSNVFDFSTDTDDDKPLKEIRQLLQAKNSMLSLRADRGGRLCNISQVVEKISVESVVAITSLSPTPVQSVVAIRSPSPRSKNLSQPPTRVQSVVAISSPSPRSKNLSHSPTPVVMDELSSQLSNIKKELECLEAMRLADLKQRMCKA